VSTRTDRQDLPPAIIVGGSANALSATRSLSRAGVSVHALCPRDTHVRFSRFGRWVPLEYGGEVQPLWLEWLLGDGARALKGAVLFPCSDDGLELLAHHEAALKSHYVLPEGPSAVVLAMLDKAKTYELARAAGVPAPGTWAIHTREELEAVLPGLAYPSFLKPRLSHRFQKVFPAKLFTAHSAEEMRAQFARVEGTGLEMLVTEIVPGGDGGYCSYFTYLDEKLQPLFHFTKRKPRQYPNGRGMGTYHVTDWNPEAAQLGLRLFQAAGLRGLGNVEFKRDPRDGALKMIECNPRLTLADDLIMRSGVNLSLFIYNRLVGRPLPRMEPYRRGVTMVFPFSDLRAFLSYRRSGELTLAQWLRTLIPPPHMPYFWWTDPWPSIRQGLRSVRVILGKRLARLFGRAGGPAPQAVRAKAP
jgi:predicted ATP-grasp superfamily ATP-dependent carboligase